tara:strand:- start:45 stop:1166 length:1122 start_codon:yes stop_codon:yes gene_type:complete
MCAKNAFEIFEELKDPRIERKTKHRLATIISIAVCGVMVGAETFEDIELYGHAKKDWFSMYIELENGVPSHDTFRRVFGLICPKSFQDLFSKWIQLIFGGIESGHIAIDGKSLRGSKRRKGNLDPIHIVNAFCCENTCFLAQLAVKNKCGEKSVLPEIIDQLHIQDTLISIDAGGCYPDIATHIRAKKGDYLFGLKGNQKTSFEAAKTYFETHVFGQESVVFPDHDAFDHSHGRCVRRRVFVRDIDVNDHPVLAKWPDLSRLIATETISIRDNKPISSQFRYYISSSSISADMLARSIRNHWSIENSLHWVLDVSLAEDASRIRDAIAAQNMSALRKFTLNVLRKDPKKISLKAKRKLAAWSDTYLLSLLKLC